MSDTRLRKKVREYRVSARGQKRARPHWSRARETSPEDQR